MDFFGIGPGEILLILLIALMVFGPGKLPEVARGLGKAVREFRKYSSDMTKEFREEFDKEVNAVNASPQPREKPKEGGEAISPEITPDNAENIPPQDEAH